MNLFTRYESSYTWGMIIVFSAAAALLATFIGLLYGITTALPHLLYIPVVIAAYRYPRRGTLIAGIIGGIYLLQVLILAGLTSAIIPEAVVRTLALIIIGWLIAMLTLRLREQEELYQGLFDHSEGGSILIAETGGSRTIENINWMAAGLLMRKTDELKGRSISVFWGGEEAEAFFRRLLQEGTVYAAEVKFTLPNEGALIALVSAATLPNGRAVLTFFDITRRVHAEHALKTANEKLTLLSRFSTDHLHRSVDDILETVDEADAKTTDRGIHEYLDRIRTLAWGVARQLFLTESYKDLGALTQVWIDVQRTLDAVQLPPYAGSVSIRIWTERLEINADPLFADVLKHLLENPLRYNDGAVNNIVAVWRETEDGLELIIKDDGLGVSASRKQQIFEYDAEGTAGIGLFVCRQIAEVTGMTLEENGTEGQGSRFVIRVPRGDYRIEAMTPDAPPLPIAHTQVQIPVHYGTGVIVRELLSAEFSHADVLWTDYHNTKGDPRTDRIFAAFLNGQAVSLARCRKHPDGFEVDGVFTPASWRGHGYASAVVRGLIEACGQDTLYMHSVLNLTGFYGTFGFVPIDEKELPPTIRERFAWAGGEMEGANVRPMKRDVTPR